MFKNFKRMLDTFSENGRYAKAGKWHIANGGYDLWFEIYYENQPVLNCIDGEISYHFSSELSEENVRKLVQKVLEWRHELRIEHNELTLPCKKGLYDVKNNMGRCPKKCPYGAWNGGVCKTKCPDCKGDLFLTHDKTLYCVDCEEMKENEEF